MKLKGAVIITGVAMLVLEAICFILAYQQVASTTEPVDPVLVNLEYVPYMIAAMTIAFVAFFTLLFAFIVFLLRARLREHFWGLVTLFLAFVLPIVVYSILF